VLRPRASHPITPPNGCWSDVNPRWAGRVRAAAALACSSNQLTGSRLDRRKEASASQIDQAVTAGAAL
jgi:hypothetical protein